MNPVDLPGLTPLEKMLVKHEGLSCKVYLDNMGIATIGVGRNLRDVGVSVEESIFLLGNDIDTAQKALREIFPVFSTLDKVRQDVLTDMCFMGVGKMREFVKMWQALEAKDYALAAAEMLSSAWASEVGNRAQDLATMMRTGAYL